jgi:hypothetical protein
MKRLLAIFLLLFALPSFAQSASAEPLTKEQQRLLANNVATLFEELFVDEARGRAIAAELRRRAEAGKFDTVMTPQAFAEAFTAQLHEIEDDKHLRLTFASANATSPILTAAELRVQLQQGPGMPGGGGGPPAMQPETARRNNYDFRRVRHLDGNVGYFEVTLLHPPNAAADTVASLFGFLKNVDAMIIDLRQTRGGAQQMVNLISSYFFPPDGRELQTSRFRRGGANVSRVVDVAGPRLEHVDLYILIGPGTFSAGEALAYGLQQYGRATLIGEKTLGGGRHNTFIPLGGGFTSSVSIGEVVHPKSGRSWQGTGVVPDVAVKAGENPVDVAHKLAVTKLAAKTNDAARKKELEKVAEAVK